MGPGQRLGISSQCQPDWRAWLTPPRGDVTRLRMKWFLAQQRRHRCPKQKPPWWSSAPAWPASRWRCTWPAQARWRCSPSAAWTKRPPPGRRAASSACWARTTASSRTCATRRTPAPAWSTSTPRASSPSTAPAAVEWLVDAGRAVLARPDGPARPAPHARRRPRVRRIVHAADATGRAIHDALLEQGARAPEHHAARALDGDRPDHVAPSASATSRRAATASTRSTSTAQRVETLPRAGGGAGHRRRRQGLPLHHQPRHRHRRRHRDGVARRLPRRRTWSSSSSTRPACTTRRRAAS